MPDDFHLLQALRSTRALAERRDGDAWRELAADAGTVIEAITAREHSRVPGEEGTDELLRPRLAEEDAATTVAALRALEERPDDEQLTTARDRVRALAERVG